MEETYAEKHVKEQVDEAYAIKSYMAQEQKHNVTDIVKDYSRRLLGFIRPRVNNEEDAEDILQEVFYELSNSLRFMQPVEQVTSWLFTVARNRITDLYRKKKPETFSALEIIGDDEGLTELTGLLVENGDSSETLYLQNLIRDEISKALTELPREQREVFEMNEIKDISFKEISKLTGVPVNTLLSRKRYAVLHLREKLRDLYDEIINY